MDDELKDAIKHWDETMEALPPDLATYHWHRLAVVEQHASRVAYAIPMYHQGGLSKAWYAMASDDTDEPDGWLITNLVKPKEL